MTAAEQAAAQRRACAHLAFLLEMAAHENLPVLAWTVDTAGCGLTGWSHDPSPGRRRRDIRAWSDSLIATWGEHPWHSGGSAVRAAAERRDPRHGTCKISLAADVYPESEEGSGDD